MTFVTANPRGLRVAVIGLGRMGLRHIEAVRNLDMTLTGVCDRVPAAVEKACSTAGLSVDAGFSDARELLHRVRPEAVVIATTAPSHAELVMSAAEAGTRFILCEKPMAASLAAADRMAIACERAGSVLAVNHQMRFMPQYTRVKELIGGSELGPLVSILVAGSNFGLAMNASHYFEMYRYLSGTNVHSVQAWFEGQQLVNPRGAEFDDRSGRLLAWGEGGPAMYIDFSASAGYGLQVVYICTFGQIAVDELTGHMRVAARKAEFRDLPTARYGMPADVREVVIEPADTVAPTMSVWRALLNGESFPDAQAGTHALACLVAAHASHDQQGRPVRLDSDELQRERAFRWA